jgi:hypothetical protein
MRVWSRATRIPEIYGAIVAVGLILYFFTMYAVGLLHVIELRLLNLFIMGAGIFFALKQYKKTHSDHLDYFTALVTGAATAAIGAATFALFLFIYLSLDNGLMQSIKENQPLGIYMNPYIASFIVFFEGLFSGFGIAYMLTNFASSDTPVVDRAVDKMPKI